MTATAKRQFVEMVSHPILVKRAWATYALVVTLVCGFLGVLLWREADARRAFTDALYIVRVYPDGHTETGVASHGDLAAVPPDALRYFLQEFTKNHFSRVRGITERQYPASLLFLSDEEKAKADAHEQSTHDVQTWSSASLSQDAVDVTVSQVQLRHITSEPYEAVVEFSKVFKNPVTGLPSRAPERYTAQVHFVAAPTRRSADINPLGLQITYLSLDKALAAN